jgi:hypothetical protein
MPTQLFLAPAASGKEEGLTALNEQNPTRLLATLLQRDQVETTRQRDTTLAVPVMQQLNSLDDNCANG